MNANRMQSGVLMAANRVSRKLGQLFHSQPTRRLIVRWLQRHAMPKLNLKAEAVAHLNNSESMEIKAMEPVKREHDQGNMASNRVMKPFDICQCSLLLPETKQKVMFNTSGCLILRHGMVLLRNYVSLNGQVEIVRECRRLGLSRGGFYKPEVGPNLQIMCLGLYWDSKMRKYGEKRSFDGLKPPPLPRNFIELTTGAIAAAHDLINSDIGEGRAEDILPHMDPDICIVNFYATGGRLGLHQDKDESHQSLTKGLPVVSISLGDSAIFAYGETRSKVHKVLLKSGDVLIFGGRSRLIYHGVESIIPNSAPPAFNQATNLRPGRLNLTFRKY